MTAAQLPVEYLVRNMIRDMAVGTWGYAVPWAMMVDENTMCYLCGTYTVERGTGGTSEMLVERRKDGWYVRLDGLQHRWRRSRNIPWVGAQASDLVPVQGFIDGRQGDRGRLMA